MVQRPSRWKAKLPLPPGTAIAEDRSDASSLCVVFSIDAKVDVAGFFDRHLPNAGWRLVNVVWERGALRYQYEARGRVCELTLPNGGGRGEFIVRIVRT